MNIKCKICCVISISALISVCLLYTVHREKRNIGADNGPSLFQGQVNEKDESIIRNNEELLHFKGELKEDEIIVNEEEDEQDEEDEEAIDKDEAEAEFVDVDEFHGAGKYMEHENVAVKQDVDDDGNRGEPDEEDGEDHEAVGEEDVDEDDGEMHPNNHDDQEEDDDDDEEEDGDEDEMDDAHEHIDDDGNNGAGNDDDVDENEDVDDAPADNNVHDET